MTTGERPSYPFHPTPASKPQCPPTDRQSYPQPQPLTLCTPSPETLSPEPQPPVPRSRHEAGNVGVEYADPAAIREGLASARCSHGADRKEFGMEDLMAWGLVNTFDAVHTNGAKLRRERFGDLLGIGLCTGKTLVRNLNLYFSRREVEEALGRLDQQQQAQQEQVEEVAAAGLKGDRVAGSAAAAAAAGAAGGGGTGQKSPE